MMMRRPVDLTSFDPAPAVPAGPSADYLAGYADAMAECEQREAARTAHALTELAAHFSALAFTHSDARRTVLASLTPFFDALCQQLLPGTRGTSLRLYLAEALDQAAAQDLPAHIKIDLAPEDHALMTAHAAQLPSYCSLQLRTELPPGMVLIGTKAGETCLDVQAIHTCLQDLMQIAAHIIAKPQPEENHVRHSA